jgi:cytochrome c oxidase subunit 1
LAEQERNADHHIHMPSPSYWPLVVAFGLPVIALGLVYNHVISVVGAIIVLLGVYGWVQEPSVASGEDHDPPSSASKELATVG